MGDRLRTGAAVDIGALVGVAVGPEVGEGVGVGVLVGVGVGVGVGVFVGALVAVGTGVAELFEEPLLELDRSTIFDEPSGLRPAVCPEAGAATVPPDPYVI